jgi:hypothetical protein
VATVGFSGIAQLLDRGVQTIQHQTKELARWFGQPNQNCCKKWLTPNSFFATIMACWAMMHNIFLNLIGNFERQLYVRR